MDIDVDVDADRRRLRRREQLVEQACRDRGEHARWNVCRQRRVTKLAVRRHDAHVRLAGVDIDPDPGVGGIRDRGTLDHRSAVEPQRALGWRQARDVDVSIRERDLERARQLALRRIGQHHDSIARVRERAGRHTPQDQESSCSHGRVVRGR